jgi:hypothetical protein
MQLQMAHTTNSLPMLLFRAALLHSVRIEEARLRRNRVMESPGSFLRKTSDAWEKQNDTKRIDEITIESLARGRTSGFLETNHSICRYDICARGEQAVEHSYISNKSQAFTETHVGSLLRHLGDEFRHGAAWIKRCAKTLSLFTKPGRSQPARLSNILRYPSVKEGYKLSSEPLARFSTCAWLY